MKKSAWNRGLALILSLAMAVMLGGCAGSGKDSTDAAGTPGKATVKENGMVFTQTENVGACTDSDTTDYKKFKNFTEISETFALTPGLMEHLVPQGMDQHDETGNIYMSGYIKKGEFNPFHSDNPSVVVMMDASGEMKAEYTMYYADGTAFESHMGGVAVSEDTMFVSASQKKDADGDPTYWVAAIPLAELVTEGHQDVKIDTFYQVPVQPSWLNYSNDILWVGNFYLEGNDSYQPPVTIGTVAADTDKEDFASYILGYDLTEQGAARMETAEGEPAMPDADKVYATTDRIQGMTMLVDGRIVLSQSYGRKNNAQLLVYDPSMASVKTISIDGNEYDCMMLEKKVCRDHLYMTMPMTEGITVKDDGSGLEVLVLYESGSILYSGDGTYDTNAGKFRTDYIWKMSVPEK